MRAAVLGFLFIIGCSPDGTSDGKGRVAADNARGVAEMWRMAHKGDCPRSTDLGKDGIDPWGRPIEIVCGISPLVIARSFGADGEPGTEDDAYSPDRGAPSENRQAAAARMIVEYMAKYAVEIKRYHSCPSTIDPWGTNTSAVCVRSGATITSAGPDRKFNTADDVSVRVDALK